MADKEYVWYASYGSNLLEERFLCYIRGGQPIGSETKYKGCSNNSLPIGKEEIYICSELYFAKNSDSWDNGGVAFLKGNLESKQQTLGRMYLITNEQFVDVVRQETKTKEDINIDFEKAIVDGSVIFKRRSWYGNLIYLGTQSGFPIFTFTNENKFNSPTKPSENYLKVIIKGLRETYDYLNSQEISQYFITKDGIAENYTINELNKKIGRAHV